MKSPFGTNGAYSLTSLSLPLTLLNDDGDSDSDTTEYLNDDPSFPLQIPVITYMEGLYKVTDRINSQHGRIRFFASFCCAAKPTCQNFEVLVWEYACM